MTEGWWRWWWWWKSIVNGSDDSSVRLERKFNLTKKILARIKHCTFDNQLLCCFSKKYYVYIFCMFIFFVCEHWNWYHAGWILFPTFFCPCLDCLEMVTLIQRQITPTKWLYSVARWQSSHRRQLNLADVLIWQRDKVVFLLAVTKIQY